MLCKRIGCCATVDNTNSCTVIRLLQHQHANLAARPHVAPGPGDLYLHLCAASSTGTNYPKANVVRTLSVHIPREIHS